MSFHRRPWFAALLSLLIPGVGHLYCGRLKRSLFVSVVVLSSAILSSYLAALSFTGMLLALTYLLAVHLLVAGDAAKIAAKGVSARASLWLIGLFVLLFIPIYETARHFYGSAAFSIPSTEMAPTLMPGDQVMVDKFAFRFSSPQVGDVVVLRDPMGAGALYIKRVVAGPGDTVETVGDIVLVNDTSVTGDKKVADEVFQAGEDADFPEAIVPNDHLFVLGDNLAHLDDSRRLGFVPVSAIMGRVMYVFASLPEGSGAPDLARVGLTVR